MSDYSQITDFSAKDALTTGDPEKIILGSDMDAELAAISVAIATKLDNTDFTSLGGAVTASAAELNILDGATLSTTELNYVDGVTSAIQTQLDAKLASASYTAADVLTKIKTVDGSGSGLDADLLDGLSSAAFAQLAQSNTFANPITVSIAGDNNGFVDTNSAASVSMFCGVGVANGRIGTSTNHPFLFYTNNVNVGSISTAGVWTLNGVAQTDFARKSQSNTFTVSPQTVSAAEAQWRATNGTITTLLWASTADGKGYVGTNTAHNFAILYNGAPAIDISGTSLAAISLGGVAASDFARQSQANTFTATQTIQNAAPELFLSETDAAANNKHWSILISAEQLRGIVYNDVFSGNNWLVVDRTGNTVDQVALSATEIDLTATTLDFNGAADFSANVLIGTDFGWSGDLDTYINNPSANTIRIVTANAVTASFSTAEVDLTATTLDFNGAMDLSGNATVGGTLGVTGATTLSSTLGVTGAVTAGTIANSTSTTLVAGQLHFITGTATLPNLTAGQWVQVVNDSASAITINKNASDTTYWTTTGASVSTSFTLAARGVLTATCSPAGSVVYVSGSGITSAT